MRVLSTLLASAALSLVPVAAHADERLAPAEPENQWYGWQILAADVGALGMTWAAASVGDAYGAPLLATYFLASPIVHLAHRRGGAAYGSLILRTMLPITGAALADRDCSGSEDCGIGAAARGFALGMGVASLIDAFALSWEPKPIKPRSTAVTPTVSFTGQGMSLGLAGIF